MDYGSLNLSDRLVRMNASHMQVDVAVLTRLAQAYGDAVKARELLEIMVVAPWPGLSAMTEYWQKTISKLKAHEGASDSLELHPQGRLFCGACRWQFTVIAAACRGRFMPHADFNAIDYSVVT